MLSFSKITFLTTLCITFVGFSQNNVDVSSSQAWNAYVNAFNVSNNSYAFGFSYTFSDLRATSTASSVTLEPNVAIWTGEAANPAWFDQAATEQTPLLYIEASSFIEDNSLAGTDLIFSGNIDEADLNSDYTPIAFIKALDPNSGYATVVNNTVSISTEGAFEVSATGAELASGFIIQYGFSITGPLANPSDPNLGSVKVTKNIITNMGVTDFANSSIIAIAKNHKSEWLLSSSNSLITNVVVYNMSGKIVTSNKFESASVKLSSYGLSNGVYVAKVETSNGIEKIKLIKD
jgi:hypothetical protein